MAAHQVARFLGAEGSSAEVKRSGKGGKEGEKALKSFEIPAVEPRSGGIDYAATWPAINGS